jgi:hypothetical protein
MSVVTACGCVALAGVVALLLRHLCGWRPLAHYPPEVAAFLRAFAAELRERHPRLELRGKLRGRFALVLALDGQETAIPMQNLLARYQESPGRLREMVQSLADELAQKTIEQPEHHPFAEVFDDILPQVRGLAWIAAQGAGFSSSALVHRPLGADLAVCYVIDDPSCMVFVCQAHLRQWRKNEADLWQIARRNLQRRARVPLPADGGPVLVRTGDGYDAARLLLLGQDAADLLVAVPDRDVLWYGPAGAAELDDLCARSADWNRSAPHPVSPHVYRLHRGTLEAVTPPAV